MAVRKYQQIATGFVAFLVIIAALIVGYFLVTVYEKKQAQHSFQTYLVKEQKIKKELPYYSPSPVSDSTWLSDFQGVGCSTGLSKNYIDVTSRIDRSTSDIASMTDGLAILSVKYRSIPDVAKAYELLKENQISFQTQLNSNQQIWQIALNEEGNECGFNRTYSPSEYTANNDKVATITADMRKQASLINQNDDEIDAYLK